jgi:hypothetical protein
MTLLNVFCFFSLEGKVFFSEEKKQKTFNFGRVL